MEFNREKIEALKRETLERIQRAKEAQVPASEAPPEVERFSGLVLKSDRTIPQEELNSLMAKRRFIPLKNALSEIRPNTVVDQDWVTIGVLVRRSEPKVAKTNNKYVVMTLSDLEGVEVTLLLFDSAYERWWRESLGTVIALLNGEAMPGAQSFKVDVGTKLLKLGEAKMYGMCQGISASERCSNPVNLKYGQLCTRHSTSIRPRHRPELIAPSIVPASSYPRPKPADVVAKPPLKPSAKDVSALDRYLQSRNQMSLDKGEEFVMLDLPTLKRKLDSEQTIPPKQPKLTSDQA